MPREAPQDVPEAATPPRLWTVTEANARLPALRELLVQLREWAVRLREVHAEQHRLAEFWGRELEAPDHVDRPLKERLDAERVNLSRRLEEALASLGGEGIEVKDLETGLVDFYAVLGGSLVLLCWRRDEAAVGFYHTLEGGFRGRRPIPSPTGAVAADPGSTL
jgi:hypothetical protein